MNEDRMVRLMLVDDHEVVRQGLKTLLQRKPGFAVVAEAATAEEAIAEARRTEPDVIVMDVRLPDGTGIEACREIRGLLPATRVLMLTSYPDQEAALASLLAGAAGFVVKETRAHDLVQSIEIVAGGGSILDASIAERALDRIRAIASGERTTSQRHLDQLTDQERTILPLIAEGRTNKEIGVALRLSDKTIKNYVSSILAKLGVARRSQAAAFAVQQADDFPSNFEGYSHWHHALSLAGRKATGPPA